jgi:hypothetical protein
MELTSELKTFFTEAASKLKGYARRFFQAQVVKLLGKGGQRRAEKELAWNRGTIRKGMHELESGIRCEDAFSARGRKAAEEHLPNLLEDIKDIMDAQSQTDPTFKTTRLFARVSAKAVREQLIKHKGYRDKELPCEETIRVKINQLGYRLRSVQKSRPKKKIPETDAIFEQLDKLHKEAEQDETILRLSMDAKALPEKSSSPRLWRNRSNAHKPLFQARQPLKSLLQLSHFLWGQFHTAWVRFLDHLDNKRMIAFPSHILSKVQYGLNRVQQTAIPVVFHHSPDTFNWIVLAVIGGGNEQVGRSLETHQQTR